MKGLYLASLVLLLMYCNTTVCADSWRSSFTLKVVLVRLSFGYPLLIVTSQDSLSIQHWWWRNSGRKEESGRMKKKIFLSCVKNGCEMRENGGIFRIICELKEAFSSNSSTLYAVLSTIKMINLFTVFENHWKYIILHFKRSELRLHFEWTKVD